MKTVKTALSLLGLMSFALGLLYPLVLTGIAQLFFPHRANGSLITRQGKVIGSELIGQRFESKAYFHGRPSAVDYHAQGSGASNYGPNEAKWQQLVLERISDTRRSNRLDSAQSIPADLVTASASGLDPHISVEAAILQVPRIAQARHLSDATLRQFVLANAERSVFAPPHVNVLKLNLALDGYVRRHLLDTREKP